MCLFQDERHKLITDNYQSRHQLHITEQVHQDVTTFQKVKHFFPFSQLQSLQLHSPTLNFTLPSLNFISTSTSLHRHSTLLHHHSTLLHLHSTLLSLHFHFTSPSLNFAFTSPSLKFAFTSPSLNLPYHWDVASLCLFYEYFHDNSSNELS